VNSNMGKKFREVDGRLWLVGAVVLMLSVISLAWNRPPSELTGEHAQARTATPTLLPTPAPAEVNLEAIPTRTPLPAELLDNYRQTTGIIIFAGVVVLIVVAGVFNQLVHERKNSQ
jgi:hypothetical protein